MRNRNSAQGKKEGSLSKNDLWDLQSERKKAREEYNKIKDEYDRSKSQSEELRGRAAT